MLLGSDACHRVISVLWVGDMLVFVTLGTVGVCETLLLYFLWHAWRTRESREHVSDRTVELGVLRRVRAPEMQAESIAATSLHPFAPRPVVNEALT